MSNGNMREQMPTVAAWIDGLRDAFGKDYIDRQIRRGLKGEGVFHAVERGHEIGRPPVRGVRIGKDGRGNRVNLDGCGAAPGEYESRSGQVAWQAALEQQAIENEKRG